MEEGSTYQGHSFGAAKSVAGEVVFNTSMVGYPESLTDPSYHGQILVLTYPLIGNYGIPETKVVDQLDEWFESDKVHIRGLVISEYSYNFSHWSAGKSLSTWLIEHDVPGICNVDTRMLTKRLRQEGTMLGKVCFADQDLNFSDPNQVNLVGEVSIKKPMTYLPEDKNEEISLSCQMGNKNNGLLNSYGNGAADHGSSNPHLRHLLRKSDLSPGCRSRYL